MRFKKFLLLIATLSLLIVSLGGCGFLKSSNTNTEVENTEVENTEVPDIDESRFIAEKTEIGILSDDKQDYFDFDYAYILTDNQTGKQYLYTYCSPNYYGGGASMVELGSTVEPSTNNTNE